MGIQPFSIKKRKKLQEQVCELYKAGLTFREVSKKLKISHEFARTLWKEAGVDSKSLTAVDR